MKKLLWSLSALVIYMIAYSVLVDTHKPSIWDRSGQDFAFRSSYPKVSQWDKKNMWHMGFMFPKVGPANYIFLPIDQCWRTIKGLPPSMITNSDSYWLEYFEYKIACGDFKRSKSKAEPQAGADQPATKPADKPPVKDQPSTPTSKVVPR
jgi:hypothetical protein